MMTCLAQGPHGAPSGPFSLAYLASISKGANLRGPEWRGNVGEDRTLQALASEGLQSELLAFLPVLRSFDNSANGYARGEGIVSQVWKAQTEGQACLSKYSTCLFWQVR